MIDAGLAAAIGDALGRPIESARRAAGGSIAESYAVTLEGGERAFVKTHATLPAAAFLREAEGLAYLAETRTVRVPRVLATGELDGRGFLALELLKIGGSSSAQQEEAFGRSLALLHATSAPRFGLAAPNHLATLPQDNTEGPSWAEFYRTRRLAPLVSRALARGVATASLARRFDQLYDLLEQRVGPPEPPARLHGDLWGGNRVVDARGDSWLIDPSVYAGHREVDLAMMRLFGGFSSKVWSAYQEAAPLAPGHQDRVPLYQLYPLLAHLVMFGGSYLGQVEDALARVL